MDSDVEAKQVFDSSGYFINFGLAAIFVITYYKIFLSKRQVSLFGRPCSTPRWNVGLKQLWALMTIVRHRFLRKRSNPVYNLVGCDQHLEFENRRDTLTNFSSDVLRVLAFDQNGNSIGFSFSYYESWSEVALHIALSDGSTFVHPSAPISFIGSSKTRNEEWESGGLKFEIIEPLLRYRVTFSGLLNKVDKVTSETSSHYVRLNFIWSACGRLINLKDDWHPRLMSEALAREPWHQHEWIHYIKDQGSGFDQWGAMRGELSVDSGAPLDLNLPSLRQRRWGPAEANTLVRRVGFTGFTSDGLLYYIRATCSPVGLTYAKFGHVMQPNLQQYSISKCDIGLQNLSDNTKAALPTHVMVSFTANGRHYNAFSTLTNEFRVKGQNFLARLAPSQISVNGCCGLGLTEFWYRVDEEIPISKHLNPAVCEVQENDVKDILVIPFSEEAGKNSNLTGGKGASLSVLASLKSDKFDVPAGFCITVNALEMHLKKNPNLLKDITALSTFSETDLKYHCEAVSSQLKTTPVCDAVSKDIIEQLSTFLDASVAVRSSAVGEDSAQLSAAGQNATLLGVRGEQEVLGAVQECWASLYSFQSVQYRRQHGQPIRCDMAVVVQEMVAAEKAGVLFTRNPITGDPRNILVTANYGLGETVVSGDVDPDTFEIRRNPDDTLEIASTTVGEKKHQIILTDRGTEKRETPSENAKAACLTPTEVLSLGHVALFMEASFRSPRDLEWAIVGSKTYLLQSRPITTISQWTDHELLHEMNTAIMSDINVVTVANTGEVLPGALTVLSQSIILSILNSGEVPSLTCVTHHHSTLNVLTTLLSLPEKEITIGNKIGDFAIVGHVIVSPELHQMAVRRNGVFTKMATLPLVLDAIKDALLMKRHVSAATEIGNTFKLRPETFESALELHQALTIQLTLLRRAAQVHSLSSKNNVFFQTIVLSVLIGGNQDISNDNIVDISTICTSCSDLVSADIPESLERLSITIAESKDGEEFIELSKGEGRNWLRKHNPAASEEFENFLKKHGHRGIREFELAAEVWAMNPEKVIEMLQSMVKGRLLGKGKKETEKKKVPTPEEIVEQLRSPVQPRVKSFLVKLVKLLRSSVASRETTKAALISVVHQFRLGYRRLGELMVQEGVLPRLEHIFHLTHYEIGRMMKTKDPVLVIKATRRHRMFAQWDSLKFPEVMIGIPKPLEEASWQGNQEGSVKLTGTPVYPGNTLARALVITDLADIDQLRPGDVLVTYSTDVGWSPYFPMLGGVVTELGGLISHGAVVAREYGLPCLVGAANATSLFKTGDTVLLSGSAGTLEKISDWEEKTEL